MEHFCATFDFSTDTTGLQAPGEVTDCKFMGGTPLESCPTASAVGTCTWMAADGSTWKKTWYSDTTIPKTTEEAANDCAQGGGKFQ